MSQQRQLVEVMVLQYEGSAAQAQSAGARVRERVRWVGECWGNDAVNALQDTIDEAEKLSQGGPLAFAAEATPHTTVEILMQATPLGYDPTKREPIGPTESISGGNRIHISASGLGLVLARIGAGVHSRLVTTGPADIRSGDEAGSFAAGPRVVQPETAVAGATDERDQT